MSPDSDWSLDAGVRRPVPELVSAKIAELIDAGNISRGAPLPPEHELADKFGVSRSSVRTALQQLKHRGLVEVTHGRGWRTTLEVPDLPDLAPAPSPTHDLAQLSEVRIALEATATRLAARMVTDAEIRDIVEAHEGHRTASPDDLETAMKWDEVFHGLIFKAARYTLLEDMYEMLVPTIRPLRVSCLERDGGEALKASAAGHNTIIHFLKNHDEIGAKAAMTSHLQQFFQRAGVVS